MCGITGMQYFEKERAVDPLLLNRMTDLLSHRGPDDKGIFIDKNTGLGFRRLSVIDLTQAARQPMSNEDGTVWGVFNGEIYNFPELKYALERKGHAFRSRCDSEVLIHAYEEHGTDCVSGFNGMFAFAVWDKKRQQLFCGRDRAGEKPFFYYHDDKKFVFGSELKVILADAEFKKEIDPSALDAYLSYMYIPDPNSIFKGIRKLPAAHTLTCRNGKIEIKKYWQVDYADHPPRKEHEYAEELRGLLEDAVKIRMHSDVPLGVFLSGGIDSSSVAALASLVSAETVSTFSVSGGSGVFNELPYAGIVARRFNTSHFEFTATAEDMEALLPRLIGFIDEPFADSSMVPTYYVSKMARQKVTVALSGEGADEIFGGYPWYKRSLMVERFRKILPSAAARKALEKIAAAACGGPETGRGRLFRYVKKIDRLNRLSLMSEGNRYESIRRLFQSDLKRKILKDDLIFVDEARFVNGAYEDNNAGHCLDRALNADLKTYLPGDLLTKVDRMSMANSLEVRAPFLDHRIIEFGARVPARLKIRGGLTKYILRKAMRGIVPREILDRREKRGFSVPVDRWFRHELKDFAKAVLLDQATSRRGIFSEEGMGRILESHGEGHFEYGHHIWAMLVFELWARRYLDGGIRE